MSWNHLKRIPEKKQITKNEYVEIDNDLFIYKYHSFFWGNDEQRLHLSHVTNVWLTYPSFASEDDIGVYTTLVFHFKDGSQKKISLRNFLQKDAENITQYILANYHHIESRVLK